MKFLDYVEHKSCLLTALQRNACLFSSRLFSIERIFGRTEIATKNGDILKIEVLDEILICSLKSEVFLKFCWFQQVSTVINIYWASNKFLGLFCNT